MCGRYTLTTSGESLAEVFDLDDVPPLEARYNIAPTQKVPVIRLNDDGKRYLEQLRWGLVPFWANDLSIGARLINARSETVAEKPAYRAAFRQRRCIVPADGFYEWRKEPKHKQPFRFCRPNRQPFAIAGLWESWTSPVGEVIESCTMLTTAANEVVAAIHARMPLILNIDDIDTWLRPGGQPSRPISELLLSSPADRLTSYAVSTVVNSAQNDDARCIAPMDTGMLPF
jgi:putative SOS response-associated peptidase YedK